MRTNGVWPRTGLSWSEHALAHLAPHLPGTWVMRAASLWLSQVQAAKAAIGTSPTAWAQVWASAGLALRREGWSAQPLAQALACIAWATQHALGRDLSEQQLVAAALLLDQRLIELPTGEGKTLALAAAAAVAAHAGVPVHVISSNRYLAARDAQALAPLWQALGLRVGHVASEATDGLYAHDIVYTTASELAFDHLRASLPAAVACPDSQGMRGLCMALIDEADSILLDEATVPLVISAPIPQAAAHEAQRRAQWWQALTLARALVWSVDAEAAPAGWGAKLTAQGIAHLDDLAQPLGGAWRRARLRQGLVELALTALHLLNADEHYVVRDGKVTLLDKLTGRLAPGRVWSQGLQALVELKENCPASPATQTVARTTMATFFSRYWHVAGLSGTLVEARQELARVYGLSVVTLPPRQPSRRQDGPVRVFMSADDRWRAVVNQAQTMRARGRPVLIGTDTLADSQALSAWLTQAGVPHQVIDAHHGPQEAQHVALAGLPGAITVSTRMAGRGTDIVLNDAAIAAGGLHVIHCQRNESARMDRQLLGRAARQGQPGSTETWLCLGNSEPQARPRPPKLPTSNAAALGWWQTCHAVWQRWCYRLGQKVAMHGQQQARRHLLERDRQWEQQHHQARRQGSGQPWR